MKTHAILTPKNYISRGTFFLCKTRALFGALRTLKSEYTMIQAQTLCDSSQRGDATTQKHLPSDLRQPLSRTWQLRFATTAQAIRNSSYGLPLTRGGTRRCPPAKPAAAPRCWDSPAKDGLYHAHFARGGEKYGDKNFQSSMVIRKPHVVRVARIAAVDREVPVWKN